MSRAILLVFGSLALIAWFAIQAFMVALHPLFALGGGR